MTSRMLEASARLLPAASGNDGLLTDWTTLRFVDRNGGVRYMT